MANASRIWQIPIQLDDVNQRQKNTLADFLNIQYTEIGDTYLCALMPIIPQNKQPLGIMHGGASCVLAESVGSTAANYCVDFPNFYCVGLDINTNHVRSIREGSVFAKATPHHLGKSTQVWGIEIVNESKQLISISRLTMAVLKRESNK